MASSSSSTPSSQSPKKYDVFISFRGEDTRFNFTSHLHEALRSKQIETFIDYRLEKGDEVWPSLEKAIEDSTLFLVIFSEKYASSTWCLKELTKILECSKNQCHLVMPVFYRVDPSHVRNHSGSYQEAFEKHKRKSINEQQLQKWREALAHSANLSGWHCSFNRNEAELITEIIQCVVQKLRGEYQSEDYLKDLIGIHRKMADVESLLYKGSNDDVRFIGIWGMGGMGKTTLAQAVFNKFHSAYEGSCFLSNVREKSKKYGIVALKKKLILELLGDKESHIDMVNDAIPPFAMTKLGRKKVFIVLDDVDDHREQLENLARSHCWFGPGSKILVTTRDKQVLGKEVDDIYQLQALNSHEAFNLFSINAFRNGAADPKVRELAKEVTQYAAGNPLAIKVLGSFLYGKDQEDWKSQLGKLQKLPVQEVNDILKLSLEGLDEEEKNIFLYIACSFDDYDVQEVKNLLDACGYSTKIGLTRLEDKSLLDIHGRRIHMHHLLKEMGIQIAHEKSLNDPRRCNILWIFKKNSTILKKNMESDAVQALILDFSEVEEMCLSSEAFCSMPNLKFIDFHRNFNDHVGNKLKFPSGIEFLPSLKLLRWAGYPLKSLPTTFRVEDLVQIEMPNSKLTKLWDGVQNLVNLSKIDLKLSQNLIELPDFSKAIHLAQVELGGCSKLRKVDPSILSLHSLISLNLRHCKALTSLTSNTHLKSLHHLSLENCSRLKEFSVTSECRAFELYLSFTSINGELCSSSGHLSKITSLELVSCESVTSLHKLVDLRNLHFLFAKGCNKLASNLRSTFHEMCALQFLRLDGCSELFEVPDNISLLSSLRHLNLSGSNIETLPLSIKHLSSLQRLYLHGCKRLRSLPQLPASITELFTNECPSLETLHSFLTNEDYDDKKRHNSPCFGFRNCMKLDGQSIKAAETKVLLEINNCYSWRHRHILGSQFNSTTLGIHRVMIYPGERVPEWFMYKTTESSITVDFNSIPQPWDGNFIFSAVIPKSTVAKKLLVKWFIAGQYACQFSSGTNDYGPLLSDHVCFWYDRKSYGEVQRKIEVEKKRNAQRHTYHPLLQLQFIMENYPSSDYERTEVKEYGVCATSVLEYQNYIKQIQLASHPHPNSIAMEEPFRRRKYHSLITLMNLMKK